MASVLCVSVIEAKNVLAADTASDLSFYVKLRLGHHEVKTDTSLNSMAPKFLKDVRLPVTAPATDVLQMDLLQLGPRGDLVVGSAELLVASLVNKGTVVHWFDLKAFNQAAGAQLCCVLRYLSADASRPVTPSYAIATREARERAVQVSHKTLQAPGPTATRALFSDEPAQAATAASAPATAPSPAPAKRQSAVANGSSAAVAAAWAPGTPAVSTSAASRAARSAASSVDHDSPTQSVSAATAAPVPAAAASEAKQPSNSSSSAAAAQQQQQEHGQRPRRQRPFGSPNLPLPLATATGLLLGVVVYLWKRRPAMSEACSTDEVSLVSSCFNRSSYDRYRQRLDIGVDR